MLKRRGDRAQPDEEPQQPQLAAPGAGATPRRSAPSPAGRRKLPLSLEALYKILRTRPRESNCKEPVREVGQAAGRRETKV